MLGGIIEQALAYVFAAMDGLASISNAADGMYKASWLINVTKSLRSLCTTKIIPAMGGIGIAIAATFFLISIIHLVTEDRFTPEFLAKFFAKLAISVAVVMWSDVILEAIVDFGDAFSNILTGWTTSDFLTGKGDLDDAKISFAREFRKSCELTFDIKYNATTGVWSGKGGGLFVALGAALSMLLISAVLMLISLVAVPIVTGIVFFVEISRNLELYVRGSFLPIAAGVMADDGFKGAGGRYFKKILALATQKIVISLTCVITGAMISAFFIDAFAKIDGSKVSPTAFLSSTAQTLLLALIIGAAGVGFLFKSLQVVNDLWGA